MSHLDGASKPMMNVRENRGHKLERGWLSCSSGLAQDTASNRRDLIGTEQGSTCTPGVATDSFVMPR
ncbi:hypothetical protein ACOMHN_052234 [Nucella lapillus]